MVIEDLAFGDGRRGDQELIHGDDGIGRDVEDCVELGVGSVGSRGDCRNEMG